MRNIPLKRGEICVGVERLSVAKKTGKASALFGVFVNESLDTAQQSNQTEL